MEWVAGGMDQLVVPPDADVHDVLGSIGDEVDLNRLAEWDLRQLDGVLEQGNAAIAVHHSGFSQAEDIFG